LLSAPWYLLTSALPRPALAPRRRNYAKADWTQYRQILHESIIPQRFPSREDIDRGVSYLTDAIQHASAPRLFLRFTPGSG